MAQQVFAFLVMVVLAGSLVAAPVPKDAEPSLSERILGLWKMTKSDEAIPPGTEVTVEFQPKGKMILLFRTEQATISVSGKYQVGEGKITYTLESAEGEHSETLRVKEITATKLHVVDPKDKHEHFERLAPIVKK